MKTKFVVTLVVASWIIFFPILARADGSPQAAPDASSSKTAAPEKERTWFDDHRGEPNFGTVAEFMVSLAQLTYHTKHHGERFKEWGADDCGLALKYLYEESAPKAVWVAKFWRFKARIAMQTYLTAETERFSKLDATKDHKQEFAQMLDDIFRTYYFDYLSEIEDMILFNLKMAQSEKAAK